MASMAMTVSERETFLAGVHVGIISITAPEANRAPIAVPTWYDFDPTVGVWVLTGPSSRKGLALRAAGRFTLTAQTEDSSCLYVSVEGPVIEERVATKAGDLVPMARRYNGQEGGDAYAAAFPDKPGNVGSVYIMRPKR